MALILPLLQKIINELLSSNLRENMEAKADFRKHHPQIPSNFLEFLIDKNAKKFHAKINLVVERKTAAGQQKTRVI